MPPYPMSRCEMCNSTIKSNDEYHLLIVRTEMTNMEMFGSVYQYEKLDWTSATDEEVATHMDRYRTKHYCCECLDHELGECIKERQRQQFNEEFKRAIVRSSGGISRQGFLKEY